jgi:hypothetical protein
MADSTPNPAQLLELLNTPEPPSLGPGPRTGREELASLSPRLDQALAGLSPAAEKLIRSLVLLWHDHLEQSHSLSQEIQSRDGSYAHGIMHRREPDYGNARYWFQRVGDHPCYSAIGERVQKLEGAPAKEMISRLAPHRKLDPFAFIELCEEAAGQSEEAPLLQFLRNVQQIEFEVLLEHFARP